MNLENIQTILLDVVDDSSRRYRRENGSSKKKSKKLHTDTSNGFHEYSKKYQTNEDDFSSSKGMCTYYNIVYISIATIPFGHYLLFCFKDNHAHLGAVSSSRYGKTSQSKQFLIKNKCHVDRIINEYHIG